MKTKILILFLCVFSGLTYGQSVYISGPSTASVSDTETYWANWDFSPDEGEFNWWVDGGDVIYPDPDYTSTSCRVDWTTGGQGTVWYSYSTWDNWWEENFPVYVSSPIPLPDAPVINTPTNITATSFMANWSSAASAASYQLEVSTDAASWGNLAYHQYSTVATSDNVTGLSGATTYYYRVRAVNEAGVSDWTMENVLTLPATPVVYEASNITASSFTASWISVTGAEDYLVDVWNETASVHTDLPVSGTSVTITGLSAGTTFYYRVRARNTTGASGYSTTKGVLTLPAAPANVYSNNVTTTSFTANWGSVTSATSYRLDVSPYSSFSSFVPGYSNLTVNGISQSVTGLSPGTTYHYRVRAVNGSGVSANAGNEVLTIPDVPAVYNASNITASSFTANWSSETGTDDHLVDVWSETTSVHSNLSVSAPTLAVTGLLAGTVYYYRVRARNLNGTSGYSDTKEVLTLPAAPIGMFGNNVTATSFTANWSAVTSATHYLVDVWTGTTSVYSNLLVSGTSVMVTGLSAGTIYSYRIRAVNATGTSAHSVTIDQLLLPAAPIASLATSITAHSFTANWSSVLSAVSYRLDVWAGDDPVNYLEGYSDLSVTGTSKIVSGLTPEKIYYYRVRAINTTGTSANSENIAVELKVNENYIRTIDVLVKGTTSLAQVEELVREGHVAQYSFFDGLGRPMKNIIRGGSPLGNDIVQPIVYDKFGREQRRYLPFVANGWFEENGATAYEDAALDFYNDTGGPIAYDEKPWAETAFEPSPLNRVLKQGAPGSAWQPDSDPYATTTDHSVKYAFETNVDYEVLLWTYTAPTTAFPLGLVNAGTAADPNNYGENELHKTLTKDEHQHEIIEFKDKQGRIVLKKVQGPENTWAMTYYLYDDIGNLVCVLQPEAVKNISDYFNADDNGKEAFLQKWSFRYRYDGRRRMIIKQVPGAEPVYMVYDNRDRLVMTQDGNQRNVTPTKEWTFTKYDALNRPVLTGRYNSNDDRAAIQDEVNDFHSSGNPENWYEDQGTAVHGYTNRSFPDVSVENEYLTVTYYDNYHFRDTYAGSDYNYTAHDLAAQSVVPFDRVKGQVTGTKTKVLDTSDYLWTVTYYDNRYRPIQVKRQNHKGGIDRFTTAYDFVGKELETKATHTSNQASPVITKQRLDYDHAGRLKNIYHTIGEPVNWINPVNVTVEGNSLTKTAGGSAWNGGSFSENGIGVDEDGWVEFFCTDEAVGVLGFSDTDVDVFHNTIDFGIHTDFLNKLYVYEAGQLYGPFGTYVVGDRLTLERRDRTFYYKKNGVTLYESTMASSGPLFVDVALYTEGSKYINAVLGHGSYEVQIVANEYNEVGQLVGKWLGGAANSYSQSIDYRYNIRGWLTSINNAELTNDPSTNDDVGDLFGMALLYNDEEVTLGNSGQFNGNISAVKWKTPIHETTALEDRKAYLFSYDPMHRLTEASFVAYDPSANWTAEANAFDESMTYDLNGNIETLQRNKAKAGLTAFSIVSDQIDDLDYTYLNGNQLSQVQDFTLKDGGFKDGSSNPNEFEYDDNGNLIKDLNKGINTISYNHLNLPSLITFSNGNTIQYTYDAVGTKLKQTVTESSNTKTTDYVGTMVYEQNNLLFFSIPEGRIVNNNGEYEYEFMLKDHLGNTRVVFGNPFEGNNLVPNGNCKTLDYFVNAQDVSRTLETIDGESYIKFVSNQNTSTPGMITTGYINVLPGEKYTFKVKGFRANNPASPAYLYVLTNAGDLIWPGANLPYGLEGENWVFNDFTVPEGVTTIRLGVLWRQGYGLAVGDIFYLNEVALFKHEDDDHPAGFELSEQSNEALRFSNYHTGNINNSGAYSSSGSSAYLLTASTQVSNQVIGPAKSIRVYTGDVVNMEAYGRYLGGTGTGTNVGSVIAGALQTAFELSAGGATDIAYQAIGNLFGDGAVIGTTGYPYEDEVTPKAFLNYILFDDDYVPYDFGYDQIESAGVIPGSTSDRMSLVAKVRKPGYIYIYLSNENEVAQEVYFDDLVIKHVKGVAIQQNDYYPFGLTFNSYQRENSIDQKYKFNNMEVLDDLDLGLYNAFFRNYDPAIGRWLGIDPKPNEMLSPYVAMSNNPLLYSDPLGDTIRVNGSDEFVQQYQKDRAEIEKTEAGRELFKYLDEHPNDVNIEEAYSVFGVIKDFFSEGAGDEDHVYSSETNVSVRKDGTLDADVEYSQINGVDVDGVKSQSHLTLTHELSHGRDILDGTYVKEAREGNVGEAVIKSEKRALERTNQVASELNQPQRVKYTLPNGQTIIVQPVQRKK